MMQLPMAADSTTAAWVAVVEAKINGLRDADACNAAIANKQKSGELPQCVQVKRCQDPNLSPY